MSHTEEAGNHSFIFFDPQGSRKRMTVYFLRMFKIFDGIIDERLQVKESLMNSEGRVRLTPQSCSGK